MSRCKLGYEGSSPSSSTNLIFKVTIMKKQFTQTNAFLVLFCIAFWLIMFLAIPSEAAPKYKVQSRNERIYRQRQAECQAEQHRIQKQGIKKYNPRKLKRNARNHR